MLTLATALRRDERGMTMVEILVVFAILALIAGITAPTVIGRLREGQAATLATNLKNLSSGIFAFRGDVGRYPKRLSYLATPITPSSLDSCNRPIPDSSTWRGPYLARSLSGSGLATAGMVIADPTERPGAAANVATLAIVITGVEVSVAEQLEAAFDGAPTNASNGAIRWGAPTAGLVTVRYHIPIRGC